MRVLPLWMAPATVPPSAVLRFHADLRVRGVALFSASRKFRNGICSYVEPLCFHSCDSWPTAVGSLRKWVDRDGQITGCVPLRGSLVWYEIGAVTTIKLLSFSHFPRPLGRP